MTVCRFLWSIWMNRCMNQSNQLYFTLHKIIADSWQLELYQDEESLWKTWPIFFSLALPSTIIMLIPVLQLFSRGIWWAGDLRQRGQIPFILSHSSMQSAWKQCWQSGIHLSASLTPKSDKHIEHDPSLRPGIRRLSPSTTFVYESMVSWSSPAVPSWDPGVISMCCTTLFALEPILSRLSSMHRTTPTAIEHKMAGIAIEKAIILKILRPLVRFVWSISPAIQLMVVTSKILHLGSFWIGQCLTFKRSVAPYKVLLGWKQGFKI